MPKGIPARLAPAAGLTIEGSSPQHGSERQQLFERPVAASAIAVFEKLLGGKTELLQGLLSSPEITPNIRKVLSAMLDPRKADRSLSALCADANVLPGEVFGAFRDATIAKATVQSLVEISQRLPKITVDYLTNAVDHAIVCPSCSGSRKEILRGNGGTKKSRKKAELEVAVPVPDKLIDCTRCNGEGTVVKAAEVGHQETVFEIMGLLKKGSGISITQTNQTIAPAQDLGGGLGGLEQLQQAVSGILFGRQPIDVSQAVDVTPDVVADLPDLPSPSPSSVSVEGPLA